MKAYIAPEFTDNQQLKQIHVATLQHTEIFRLHIEILYSKGIDAMKNDGNRVYVRIFV